MGGQVGCVPGEGREKSMGRKGLCAPPPQGVLHAWKRQVCETQPWLTAEHQLSSSLSLAGWLGACFHVDKLFLNNFF